MVTAIKRIIKEIEKRFTLSNFNSNFNDITDSNMYRVLRRNGDRRVVRLAEALKGRGPLPAGQGVADPWPLEVGNHLIRGVPVS